MGKLVVWGEKKEAGTPRGITRTCLRFLQLWLFHSVVLLREAIPDEHVPDLVHALALDVLTEHHRSRMVEGDEFRRMPGNAAE